MNSTSVSNEHIYTILTAISLIGTIGNLLTVIVYSKKKYKQTSTFFILVLAFNDLLVCSILVPMTIYMEKIFFQTENKIICKSFYFLTTTIVPSSSLLMSAIAFDRYFCICKVNCNIMNLVKARITVISIYFVSFLLGIIPLLSSVSIINQHSNNSIELNSSSDYFCFIDTESQYTKFGFLVMPLKFFYDLIYGVSVLIITTLYIMIYKEIYIRRKIKRNRKKELIFSSLISQAENGIFPETLLIKNDDFKIESVNHSQNRFCLCKNCCFKKKNQKQTFLSDRELSLITLEESLFESDIHMKNRQNYLKVQYDSSENKIIFNTLKNDLSQSTLTLKSDMMNSNKNNEKLKLKKCKKQKKIKGQIMKRFKKNEKGKNIFVRDQTINSRIIPFLILIKETRTALMLFVVSIVFIACYLPSILATRSILPNDNLYLVYLYFTNSAINPIIYSFMNRSFRSDLVKLFNIKSRTAILSSKLSSFTIFSVSPNMELRTV